MCLDNEKPEFLQKNRICVGRDFELRDNIVSGASGEDISMLGANNIAIWPGAEPASVREELTSEKADILRKNETPTNLTANHILTEELLYRQLHLTSLEGQAPADLPSPRTSACIGLLMVPSSNAALCELRTPSNTACMPMDPRLWILISHLQCDILCLNVSRKKFQRRTYFGGTSLQDERRSATACGQMKTI